MAYNEVTGLVDAFDGIGDLERGVIRCVGNAMERFFGGCPSHAPGGPLCGAAWFFD